MTAPSGALPTMPLGRTGRRISRIGLGAMPLSGEGRPEREGAKAVIRRAVALGVTLIDTADIYGLGEHEIGHNERLVAEALAETGRRDEIVVATKGGLVRRGTAWGRDARPEHLRQACDRSLAALGVERIDLYQLHGPDPAVPLLESVGALADLERAGKVAAVGLSNVTLAEGIYTLMRTGAVATDWRKVELVYQAVSSFVGRGVWDRMWQPSECAVALSGE